MLFDNIRIGCDPELIAYYNGRFIPANNIFNNNILGCDGCSSVVEIRPGHSDNPVELVAKIKKILDVAAETYPEITLFAGHYKNGYAIGGHIHIGHELFIASNTMNDYVYNDNLSRSIALSISQSNNLIDTFKTTLDYYHEILSERIDDLDEKNDRRSTSYGRRMDYRSQPHGFEYRTPGSWLLNPPIALSYMTLAKIISILSINQLLTNDLRDLTLPNFLKKALLILKQTFINIPEYLFYGSDVILNVMSKKFDWNQDIIPYWA